MGKFILHNGKFKSNDIKEKEVYNVEYQLQIVKDKILKYKIELKNYLKAKHYFDNDNIIIKAEIINKHILKNDFKNCLYVNYYFFIVNSHNDIVCFDFQTDEFLDYKISNHFNYIDNKLKFINMLNTVSLNNIQKNKYDLIIAEEATGMLIHEIVGHLSEGNNKLNWWKKGNQVFNSKITVIDDPTLKNFVGSFKFDDEGNKSRKKYLINKGRIDEGLFSSYESSDESIICNARCEDYRFIPRARMSNTYLEADIDNKNNFIESSNNYLYVYEFIRGGINYANETVCLLGKALFCQDGEIVSKTNNVFIEEPLISFTHKIKEIGNKKIFANSCWCIKDSFIPIPVKYGGPILKMKNVNFNFCQ